MADSTNDPLSRSAEIHRLLKELLGDEPYFLLLARDPLSDGLTAEWAALKGRRIEAIPDIVKNLVVTSGTLPYHPTKDAEHVKSARDISNAMRIWRYSNRPHVPTNSRAVDLSAAFPEPEQPPEIKKATAADPYVLNGPIRLNRSHRYFPKPFDEPDAFIEIPAGTIGTLIDRTDQYAFIDFGDAYRQRNVMWANVCPVNPPPS